MQPVFIYALKCPTTGEIRYIGKTKNPEVRFIQHLCYAASKKTNHRANWLRSLLTTGVKPTLEIIDEVPFEHWQQLEVAYIEFFLEQGYRLTNGTPGGEDPPSRKGTRQSPEGIEKIRAAGKLRVGEKNHHFGKAPWNKGVPQTEAVRAKISAVQLGKIISPECRAKISASLTGIKRSPETCAKIGAVHSGKIISLEQRAKISATKSGVPWSPARRAAEEKKNLWQN